MEARAEERESRALTCAKETVSVRSRRAGNRAHLDDAVLLRVRVERVLNVALSDDAEMTDKIGRASCRERVS